MDIFKVIGIGIIGAIIAIMLKSVKSELSVMAVVATGIIIVILVLSSLQEVIIAFNKIVDKTGLDSSIFSLLLKIVGVGYIAEFSSSMCSDMGADSIGKKILFASKISIFLLALPIVTKLVETVYSLIK